MSKHVCALTYGVCFVIWDLCLDIHPMGVKGMALGVRGETTGACGVGFTGGAVLKSVGEGFGVLQVCVL